MLNFFLLPSLAFVLRRHLLVDSLHICTAESMTSCAASAAQSTLSKTAKEGRIREFVEITGASSVSSSPLPLFSSTRDE